MLHVNHASATTLPETVPTFTAFMKVVKSRKIIQKINKLKDYLWIV